MRNDMPSRDEQCRMWHHSRAGFQTLPPKAHTIIISRLLRRPRERADPSLWLEVEKTSFFFSNYKLKPNTSHPERTDHVGDRVLM